MTSFANVLDAPPYFREGPDCAACLDCWGTLGCVFRLLIRVENGSLVIKRSYTFLRFCKQVRLRYGFLDEQSSP